MKSATPGLKWRRRGGQKVAYWVCRSDKWYRRFRPRPQRLWAGESPSDQDMAAIAMHCQQLQQEMLDWRWRRHNKRPSRTMSGCIYFIGCGDLVKIGFTTDLRERLEKVQLGSPETIRLLGTIPGNPTAERQLHWRFAGSRVRGEWFRLDGPVTRFIERECKA